MKVPPALFVTITLEQGYNNLQEDWNRVMKRLGREFSTHPLILSGKDLQFKRKMKTEENKLHLHAWLGDTKNKLLKDRRTAAWTLKRLWSELGHGIMVVALFDYSRAGVSRDYLFQHEWVSNGSYCNRHASCRRKGGCLYEQGKIQTPRLDASHKTLLQAVR